MVRFAYGIWSLLAACQGVAMVERLDFVGFFGKHGHGLPANYVKRCLINVSLLTGFRFFRALERAGGNPTRAAQRSAA